MTNLYFNGIDGDTGEALYPSISLKDYATLARGAVSKMAASRGLKSGIEEHDLSATGWGVVFSIHTDPRIRRALKPLLDRRRCGAASRDPLLYRELDFRQGESKRVFLARYGAMPAGPVEPTRMPYFLLLVGGPELIPYAFQYELGMQYAVGRLSFDTPEEYAAYAWSVVEAEECRSRRPEAVLFGARNTGDPATKATSSRLVRPLAKRLASADGWRLETLEGEAATKTTLGRVLGGDRTPAFLMTVSHGLGFKRFDDERKEALQGALIPSDWPGHGPAASYVYSATDVDETADLAGLITFHLACWSAGTPQLSYFNPDRRLAARDFFARLPKRLLTHENGGALAVVGHIDCALLDTFLWDEISQVALYECVFVDLMGGLPLGWAMRHFGQYAATLAGDVIRMMGKPDEFSDKEWARVWSSYQDARGYVILGDPAVRLTFS